MIAAYKYAAYPGEAAQVLLRNIRAELNDLTNAALQQRTEAYGTRGGRPFIAWAEACRDESAPKRYGGPRVQRRGGIIVQHAEVEDPVCDCDSGKKWRLCHGQEEIAQAEAALREAVPGFEPTHTLQPVRERRLSLQRQIGKSRCTVCWTWCKVVGLSACHGAPILAVDKAVVVADEFIGPLTPGEVRRSAMERLLGEKKVCAACQEPVGRRISYLSACHAAEVQEFPGQSEDLTALREANETDPSLSTGVRRPGKGRRLALIRHDEVPRASQTEALERLERGYQAAFGRIARGDKAGFPRYKKRRDYRSIGIQWEHGVSLEAHCPSCGHLVGTPDARTLEAHAKAQGVRVDPEATRKAAELREQLDGLPEGRKAERLREKLAELEARARCPGSEGPLREPGRPIIVIAWGRGSEQRRIEVPLRIHVSKPLATAARGLQEAEGSVGQPGSFQRAMAAVLKAQPELGGIKGLPKHCVLTEEADGCWFAVIQCDEVPVEVAPKTERSIGIDLGWSEMPTAKGAREVLAVIVDGEGSSDKAQAIPHPAFGERAAPRLEAAQRRLSLKLRPSLARKTSLRARDQEISAHVRSAGQYLAERLGVDWAQLSKKARRALMLQAVHGKRVPRSIRAEEARHQVAVVQGQVRRQRADFEHKVSHGIVYGGRVSAVAGVHPFSLEAAGQIAVEKMAIRDMVEQTHADPDVHDPTRLNRRNLDSGWGGLVAQIVSKGGAAGRTVVEVPAQRDQKRGGRMDSAKRILDAGKAAWSPAGEPIQTPGGMLADGERHAMPGAAAGPVAETRATKRRPRGAGGGTDAPTRGGREGSSPGTRRKPGAGSAR